MSNKIVIQILTVLFIAALAGALYWSWDQTQQLQTLNGNLKSLNAELESKSDSLEAVNTKLKKERDGYVKLFSSSKEYEEAKQKNTPEAYYDYVKSVGAENFGDDRIINEISERLLTLMEETGYVQIMDSNQKDYFFEETEKLFPSYDLYRAKGDRNVNTGVLGHPDFTNPRNKRGHFIRAGQIVNVLEIIPSGSANWAKIQYHMD